MPAAGATMIGFLTWLESVNYRPTCDMPVDPAPQEAPQPQLCSLCGDPLLERQAGIQASCSVCETQYLHIW